MKEATKNTLRRWILREYPEIEIIESGMFDETLTLKGDREEQLIIEDGWLYTKDSKYALSDTDNIDQAVTIFFWSNIIKPKEFNRTRRTYREFLEDEGLDLEIVPFDCLPCSCRKFVVNGIDADVTAVCEALIVIAVGIPHAVFYFHLSEHFTGFQHIVFL